MHLLAKKTHKRNLTIEIENSNVAMFLSWHRQIAKSKSHNPKIAGHFLLVRIPNQFATILSGLTFMAFAFGFPLPLPLPFGAGFLGVCTSCCSFAALFARFCGFEDAETASAPRLMPGAGVWQELAAHDSASCWPGGEARSYSICFRLSPKDLRSLWASSNKAGGQTRALLW